MARIVQAVNIYGPRVRHTGTVDIDQMAEWIGLRRRWFQNGRTPHYDLVASRRLAALPLGAIECDRRAFVGHMRRIRAERGRIIDSMIEHLDAMDPDWPFSTVSAVGGK